MSSYDLIDFILENDRWKKISPINKIKSAISAYGYSHSCPNNIESVRKKFKNVGTCTVTDLIGSGEFEQLIEFYLPGGWSDTTKQIGFGQYVNEFMDKNVKLKGFQVIHNLIDSLREGWENEIEIIVAFDTMRQAGIVVDGTKHSLALFVIKEKNDELLTQLLKSNAPVKYCK